MTALAPYLILCLCSILIFTSLLSWTNIRWTDWIIAVLCLLIGKKKYSSEGVSKGYRIVQVIYYSVFALTLFSLGFVVSKLGNSVPGEDIGPLSRVWIPLFNGPFAVLAIIALLAASIVLLRRAYRNTESVDVLSPFNLDIALNEYEIGNDISNAEFIAFAQASLGGLNHFKQMETIRDKLDSIRKDMDSPLLITVIGEFSSGKSTFINALLGEEVLATGISPTTATITVLHNGKDKVVNIEYLDKKRESYPIDKLHDFTASAFVDESELTNQVFKVDLYFPANILEGFDIADTPGFNSGYEHHNTITATFLEYADLVFWVLAPLQVDKQVTKDLIKKHTTYSKPYAIINKIDQLSKQIEDPEEVNNYIVNTKNELSDVFEEVFFVSAKESLKQDSDGGIEAVRSYLNTDLLTRANTIKDDVISRKILTLSNDIDVMLSACKKKLTEFTKEIKKHHSVKRKKENKESKLQNSIAYYKKDMERLNLGKKDIVVILDKMKRYYIGRDLPEEISKKARKLMNNHTGIRKKIADLELKLNALDRRRSSLDNEFNELTTNFEEYNNKAFGLKSAFDSFFGDITQEKQNLNKRSASWDTKNAKHNTDVAKHNDRVEKINTKMEDINNETLMFLNSDLIREFQKEGDKIRLLEQERIKQYKHLSNIRPKYTSIANEMSQVLRAFVPGFKCLHKRIDHSAEVDDLLSNENIDSYLAVLKKITNLDKDSAMKKEVYSNDKIMKIISGIKMNMHSAYAEESHQHRRGVTAPKFE